MKAKILLDSGAFSVWKQGGEIPLREYGRYIQEHEDILWMAVTLDAIPGRPRQPRTAEQTEEAAALSAKNTAVLRKMVKRTPLLPVFHQGERTYWLEKMIGDGYDYIGVSPNKSLRVAQKMAWLDDVFTLLSAGGYPSVKVHAFGETSHSVLTRYPWESADSTSWILIGAMGQIQVPLSTRGGGLDWQRQAALITVSQGLAGKSSASAHSHSRSYSHLGPRAQRWVSDFAAGFGFSMEELQQDDKSRKMLCAEYMKQFCAQHERRPFMSGKGFYRHSRYAVPTYTGSDRIVPVFVTGTSRQNLYMVSAQRCEHQLVSYFQILKESRSARKGSNNGFNLREYWEGGMNVPSTFPIKDAAARRRYVQHYAMRKKNAQ